MITKIQITLLTIVLSFIAASIAFADLHGPKWVEKPVQCASPQSVLDRVDKDEMLPLFSAIGNARVEDSMYSLPYGFFYNQDKGYWLFIEFFDNNTACVIGVGQGVDFNVSSEVTN